MCLSTQNDGSTDDSSDCSVATVLTEKIVDQANVSKQERFNLLVIVSASSSHLEESDLLRYIYGQDSWKTRVSTQWTKHSATV